VNHLATLVVKDNDKMDNNFLFYFFKKFKLSNLIMQTTTPSINLSTFKKIKIPLPSLSEQQKIAQVLSTVDEGIQKVDEVIEKTERLKKGLMKKLFTEGIGHKEFKKTKIGKIPKDWKVSKLGEDTNFKMIMGQSPPSSSYNSNKEGYPFLQGNADFGDIYPALYIYTKKPIKIAQKGDILISVRAPVGDINLSPQKICIGRGLSAIRVLEGDNFFYFYWLTKNKNRLKNKSTGSTFKAITKNELNNLTIPIVPFPEQQKIAQILSTVDKKIQLQKKRKERFIRIKKSLMNDLLTGRKRVGVEH
jgi:type I restriction enzyme S subunit